MREPLQPDLDCWHQGKWLMSIEPDDENQESDLEVNHEGPDEEHPYQGEVLGGAAAPVCPGFDPEPLRYLLLQPAMRILLIFSLIVTLLTAGCFAAGYALRIPGGWWPGFIALLFYSVGVVLGLIDLLVVTLLIAGYNAAALFQERAFDPCRGRFHEAAYRCRPGPFG